MLSRLSGNRIFTGYDAPDGKKPFLRFLREKKIQYVVYLHAEYGKMGTLFPKMRDGAGQGSFLPIMTAELRKQQMEGYPAIWLYRFKPSESFDGERD